MKVLYCGVFRDGTGWTQAATDYVLALDSVGVEVVPRTFKLNGRDHRPPDRLLELEARSSRGCDVVLQHLLPRDMDRNGRLRNVALYATETSDFKASGWSDRINTMDRAVVINNQQLAASRDSGVKVPLTVVPHACDTSRLERSHEPLEALRPYKERGEFLFYTVGEHVKRKNFISLLAAFHLEFDPSEPVRLVLKTDHGVTEVIKAVKAMLKLHGGREQFYKREVVLSDRLTDEGMLRLHSACDCFVLPSCGEAWALPSFDAMAMGKTPIVTACTGFLDYVSDAEGWLVEARESPVLGALDTLENLFVGGETWWSVDIPHLRRCMREAYSRPDLRRRKAAAGAKRAYDFSYERVGARLRKALEDDDPPLDHVAGPGGT